MPEEARKRVTVSSPLVYLGSIAEVTLFSRDAPSVLSVPFGALDDKHPFSREISRDTIPHEVAHAVFNQLSDFIPELELKYLSSARTDDQQLQVLHGVIREWLNEMVADMAGTALAGPDFARSAIRIMALPDEAVGIADARHPAPFIRPYIHVATLEHLKVELKVEEAKVRPLKDELDQVCGDRMKARFESCPDLTVVTLETVKDEMIKAIEVINNISLDALGGNLGDILKNCTQGSPSAQLVPNQKERLPAWSESVGKGDKFVLRLIGSLRPEHATPVSFPYCWFFRLLGLPCPS